FGNWSSGCCKRRRDQRAHVAGGATRTDSPRENRRAFAGIAMPMLNTRKMILGAAFVGAVLIGVLIWDWNRPSTSNLAPAASGETPKASVSLLSPGILSIAVGSSYTTANGLALQEDGTIILGATFANTSGPGLSESRGAVLPLTSNGQSANPAVTLIADTPSGLNGLATARDGTVVVFGQSAGPKGHSLFARLLPGGVPDPAFGNGG